MKLIRTVQRHYLDMIQYGHKNANDAYDLVVCITLTLVKYSNSRCCTLLSADDAQKSLTELNKISCCFLMSHLSITLESTFDGIMDEIDNNHSDSPN